MTAPGLATTFFTVKFSVPRVTADGRSVRWSAWYAGKNRQVSAPHEAAYLASREMAETIISLYPSKNGTVVEDSHVLGDADHVYSSLDELGEILPADALEQALSVAIKSLPKAEVKSIYNRVLKETASQGEIA